MSLWRAQDDRRALTVTLADALAPAEATVALAAVTAAWLVNVPPPAGSTVIVTVAVVVVPVALESIVPSEQVTVAVPVQVPCEALEL
jgi:hypothetical protein